MSNEAKQMSSADRECVKCGHVWTPGVRWTEPCPACEVVADGPAEGTSSLEPIRKDEVIEWLHERQLNAQRIANSKVGEDRIGWMEDAHFFESAISHMREESK